jgi:hypothetical protein
MKNINVLPSKYKYDYKKYFLIKVLAYFIFLNLSMLAIIFTAQTIYLKNLRLQIKKENTYLNEIQNLNSKFTLYKKQLNTYKNKLAEYKEKEQAFLKYFNQEYSPYASTIILFNSLKRDINISKIIYSDGQLEINGNAKNEDIFYTYYKNLESNPYLTSIVFSELDNKNQKDKKELYNYKIKLLVKKIDELN